MPDLTDLRDITDLMDHYRVISRSLWNAAFWAIPGLRNWDSREQFDQIKKLLFKALVDARVAAEDNFCDLAKVPQHVYRVVPSGSSPMPIMIHRPREGDSNRYWDDPISEVKASEVELHFLDYFDWNDMDYSDFRYYRVRIAAFPSQPHLIGREALLEHHYARVFVAATSKRGGPGQRFF